MSIKGVSFILNQAKREKSTIRAQLTFFGNKYIYQTGISIPTSQWANGKTTSKSENMKLSAIQAAMINTVIYYERIYKIPSNDEFKSKVNAFLRGDDAITITKKDKSLFVFIEKFIEESRTTKSKSAIYGYLVTCQRLKLFFNRDDVSFDEITLDFERKFKNWLLSQNYARNTIGNYFKNLCIFMREAQEVRKLHSNDDYKQFKIEKETADTIYLSMAELQKINSLEITDSLVIEHCYNNGNIPPNAKFIRIRDTLIKVKNKFLIGAMCAMRISDYNRISTDNIKNGVISIMPKKGSNLRKPQPIKIPVPPIMKEIIDSGFDLNEKVSELTFNKSIKIVCKMAGITEEITYYRTQGGKLVEFRAPKYQLVSSHTARRSGATNMRLTGVPDNLIQVCTGHKSVEMLMKYIKSAYNEDNVKELEKYAYFGEKGAKTGDNVLSYVKEVLERGENPEWLTVLKKEMGIE